MCVQRAAERGAGPRGVPQAGQPAAGRQLQDPRHRAHHDRGRRQGRHGLHRWGGCSPGNCAPLSNTSRQQRRERGHGDGGGGQLAQAPAAAVRAAQHAAAHGGQAQGQTTKQWKLFSLSLSISIFVDTSIPTLHYTAQAENVEVNVTGQNWNEANTAAEAALAR